MGNDTKKKTSDIIIKVSELFGVSLSSEDQDKEAGQGSSITYTVKVKNTGNVNENIDLKVAEGKYKDWATQGLTTTLLGEKGETEFTVTVHSVTPFSPRSVVVRPSVAQSLYLPSATLRSMFSLTLPVFFTLTV